MWAWLLPTGFPQEGRLICRTHAVHACSCPASIAAKAARSGPISQRVTLGPIFFGFGRRPSRVQRQTVALLTSARAAMVLSDTSAQSGRSSKFLSSFIAVPQIKKPAFAGSADEKKPPSGGCWVAIERLWAVGWPTVLHRFRTTKKPGRRAVPGFGQMGLRLFGQQKTHPRKKCYQNESECTRVNCHNPRCF